jgi:hypothetical protein
MIILILLIFIVPLLALVLLIKRKGSGNQQQLDRALISLLIIHLLFCFGGEGGLFYLYVKNTQELDIAHQWSEFTLIHGQPLSLPLHQFQPYSERPLLVNGIFDHNFMDQLKAAQHPHRWKLALTITTSGQTSSTETVTYHDAQRQGIEMRQYGESQMTSETSIGYQDTLVQLSTEGVSTIDLTFTMPDIPGVQTLQIAVGRAYDDDMVIINKIVVLFAVLIAVAGIISGGLLVAIIVIRRSQTANARKE